ncbi:hypothetical protein BFP97_07615 [Roseivirga sp. 4D4]|uniref:hybrid sensor histidine kinase/response regulator n=1 Tax=Roseivirga sp. 4D4 TaxID=1889784 RepID=UPI00085347A4|nr:hybrid sensor histidine kinase/response regulator [Roseivirga sp. 4D4]OEK01393.1 hypothetical protein BFP97_07615 [Roseivirga sp. 4D4]
MHINRLLLFLLLTLSTLNGFGQRNSFQNSHSIYSADEEIIEADEILVYRDDENRLIIDDVRQLQASDFIHLDDISIFNKDATYWAYFRLVSRADQDIDFVLHGGRNGKETYYLIRDEEVSVKKTGYHFPSGERDIRQGYPTRINMTLPAEETVHVYIKVESTDFNPIDIRASLVPKDIWTNRLENMNLLEGIFSGILFVVIILAFFIFGYTRERVFLFFAIYALSNMVYFLNMHGIIELYVLTNLIDPIPSLWILPLLSAAAYFTFSRFFLETHIDQPKWDRLLTVLSYFSLAMFLALSTYLFLTGNMYFAIAVMHITILVLSAFALVLIVRAARTNNIIAKYFAYGTMFFLASVLIVVVGQLIEASSNIPILVQGGIIVEIVVFSLGISHKLKRQFEDHDITQRSLILQLRKNERLQIDINQELEEIVADRTQQIKKQNQALKEARQEAEKATKDKSDFLAVMSHEIRTPLNAIISLSHIMEIDNKDKEMKEYIDALKFSAEGLHSLINDILDYNKIEAGKLRLESTEFSLIDLLRNLGESFKYKANNKGIELKIEIGEHLPDRLFGDPTRLTQILNNLISNAIKFTHEGHIHIKAVLAGIKDETAKVAFSVADTGIGIPEDKLQAIFEEYEQASEETTREYGGTGLGLSIVKKLLDLMESKIQLRSIEDKGTTFGFEIDFKIDPEFDMIDLQQQDRDKDLNQRKILVVDDNDMNRLVLKRLFQIWNASFDDADNGYDALDKIQETEYDVVLMDIEMKPINGFDTTNQLRKMRPDGTPKVIAMSAHNASEFEIELKQFGFVDFVHKPFDPEDLFQKLNLYTNRQNEQ